MAIEISVNHPHLAKGTEIEIPNVGVVPNGGSLVVDKETLDMYEARTGRKLKDDYGDGIWKHKTASEPKKANNEEGGEEVNGD